MNNQNQKYGPISQERRAEIIKSLRDHGVLTVDGVLCWIDNATGEIVPVDLEWMWANGIDLRLHINPVTVEASEESTRQALERAAAWCKQRELNDKIRDDTRGKFVFLQLNRKKSEIAIPDIDFSTLSRLCALSAYLEYADKKDKKEKTEVTDDTQEAPTETEQTEGEGGEKKNNPKKPKNIIMRSSHRSHAKATKRDIKKILGLPTRTWEQFWAECEKNGYVVGNDEDGYQLIDIFRYGKLDRKKSTKMQKLYADAFVRLYRSGRIIGPTVNRELKISDHRLIGALIYLASCHMCPATNEIVANPDESDLYKLQPLDEVGIARALGYQTDAGHAMREINKLRDLTFRLSDNGPDLYCLIRVEAGRGRGNARYIINPALIYAGDRANYQAMMQMMHWFVDGGNNDANDE